MIGIDVNELSDMIKSVSEIKDTVCLNLDNITNLIQLFNNNYSGDNLSYLYNKINNQYNNFESIKKQIENYDYVLKCVLKSYIDKSDDISKAIDRRVIENGE